MSLDMITLAQTWGPLGAAVVALAVALRTYAAGWEIATKCEGEPAR